MKQDMGACLSQKPAKGLSELVRFTWLLTGNESLAIALLEAAAEDEVADPLSVVRTFVGIHRLGLWPDAPPGDATAKLPLWSLPPLERAAFTLRYLLKLTPPQAARELELAPAAFAGLLARAFTYLGNAAQGIPLDDAAIPEMEIVYQS